jgi:hypothetical protein
VVSNRQKGDIFEYDWDNPNTWQARMSAYEWHGRLWSPFLYCYALFDCRIEREEFRKGLLKELEIAMKAVEENPALYDEKERAKLRNLKRCIEITEIK